MSLLPFVMESGEMLLKININMTSRPTFEMQTSGDSKAQFPSYDDNCSTRRYACAAARPWYSPASTRPPRTPTRSAPATLGSSGLAAG
ncbi:hypothetical protein P4118_10855 [Pseudomonas aeruginosa]|nr:hypothetical protein [Pseudomonas aeruginosa]